MFGRSLTGAKGMPPQLLLTATAAAAAVDAVASWTAIAMPCSYRRCRASRCVTAVLIDALQPMSPCLPCPAVANAVLLCLLACGGFQQSSWDNEFTDGY